MLSASQLEGLSHWRFNQLWHVAWSGLTLRCFPTRLGCATEEVRNPTSRTQHMLTHRCTTMARQLPYTHQWHESRTRGLRHLIAQVPALLLASYPSWCNVTSNDKTRDRNVERFHYVQDGNTHTATRMHQAGDHRPERDLAPSGSLASHPRREQTSKRQ